MAGTLFSAQGLGGPLGGRSRSAGFCLTSHLEWGCGRRYTCDAEGGIPRSTSSRFYVQLAQKNRLDLEDLRDRMQGLGLKCGCLHVPSVAADPEYWRFYVAAASHRQFYERVGSWHPRKRALLDSRFNRSGLQ